MTMNDKLAAYFLARPGVWLDGRELATVAGAYAWRSRCSDLRKRGLVIENRQRRVEAPNYAYAIHPRKVVVSEYRLVVSEPSQLPLQIGIDAVMT